MDIIKTLSDELSLDEARLAKTVALIDEGNTIPFIARYRKEVTGSMDDTTLRTLFDRLTYLRSLEERREEVRAAIDALGKLTPELEAALDGAKILAEIEDIWRPFKQKKRTRASMARDRGLEGLAELIFVQEDTYDAPIEELAQAYVNTEKVVPDIAAALAGACDIIAEDISDDATLRGEIRELTREYATLKCVQIGEGDSVYSMYYHFEESVKSLPSHRVLAINRGEKEEILRVSIQISQDIPLNYLFASVVTNPKSPAAKYVARALVDGYERLIAPSIEREIRAELTDNAGEGAIKLFADNLEHVLMQAPLKGSCVLGLDPGYRTGCKLAVVDKTGRVLDTAVIYPTKPHERIEEAKKTVKSLIRRHGVNVIAIGNGTASKESEIFIAGLLREIPEEVRYAMVSEAGASVYSASKLAAEEFPDFDVTQRSAVSIARRLQDPLAELVKIDPKSIGVGQYQHDMKQTRLDDALTGVVESCVNRVGVDVNTASHSLLSYVAGINATAAKNIVKYREEHGEFTRRAQILKVPRIGERAYQQCAGFLRVSGGDEILDNTGVHPESYDAARALLADFSYTERDIRDGGLKQLRAAVEKRGVAEVCEEIGVGEPTLMDIITELEKPGRDLRETLEKPILRDGVMDMNDLQPGMKLRGVVRNVIDFGAFVDIGVHQDGLVHVSQMSNKFIKHPSEVVSAGDIVDVTVLSVDPVKGRISLTMKGGK